MKNLRVYRRNSQKIILLFDWDGNDYDLKIFYKDPNSNKINEVVWEQFEIDQSKFKTLTKAICINHVANKMSPFKEYTLNLKYTDKKGTIEETIIIFPVSSTIGRDTKFKNIANGEIRIYGYDYEKNIWVPFPVNYFFREK
jgi:hypothetical protein